MFSTISIIPSVFNVNKILNIRGYSFFNIQDEKQFKSSTKFLLIFWLIAISLVWGLVRSHFANQATLNPNFPGSVPLSFCFIFIGLFALPAFLMVRSRKRLLWLLGASIFTSSLPAISAAPYINEGAYIIFIITGLTLVIAKKVSLGEVIQNKIFKLFLGYILVCILSVAINKLTGGSASQLKAGFIQIVLYFSFAIVLATFITHGVVNDNLLNSLIDGYVWGVLGQIIFVSLVLPLIFIPENNAIFQTEIWQQFKLASTEPNTGLLFAVSLPLIIWWVSLQKNKVVLYIVMGILLLTPWLMIFFGAQLARLVAIFALALCMFCHSIRRHGGAVLLSFVVSIFFYQLFPIAAETVGNVVDGVLTKVRTIVKSDSIGQAHDARLKIDSDATIYDLLTSLRASNTLSAVNIGERSDKNNGAVDNLTSTPSLVDNPPPLTEINGTQLKLDSTIDSTPVTPMKRQIPNSLIAMTSDNDLQENGWQANSLKEALSIFIRAPFTSKIIGFGAGTGEYPAGNTSQVGIIKILMETGLLGVLFFSGFVLFLITNLWKKVVSKQNRDLDFVIALTLAMIFCSAFIFAFQNWGFAMIVCIIGIIALLMDSPRLHYEASVI